MTTARKIPWYNVIIAIAVFCAFQYILIVHTVPRFQASAVLFHSLEKGMQKDLLQDPVALKDIIGKSNEAYEIYPHDPLITQKAVSILQAAKDNENGISIVEKERHRSPYNMGMNNDYGYMLVSLKEYEKAEKAFKTNLELNSNNPSALTNIGSIHLVREEYDKALDYFRKAFVFSGFSAQFSKGYIHTLGKKERYNELIRVCEKLIEKDEAFSLKRKEKMDELYPAAQKYTMKRKLTKARSRTSWTEENEKSFRSRYGQDWNQYQKEKLSSPPLVQFNLIQTVYTTLLNIALVRDDAKLFDQHYGAALQNRALDTQKRQLYSAINSYLHNDINQAVQTMNSLAKTAPNLPMSNVLRYKLQQKIQPAQSKK